MNKISVLVDKGRLIFSKYNREISEDNLNNTNVINIKNLKFTEDYILENMDLISTFFNLIAIKYNIKNVVIKNLEIALTSVKIIENLSSITNVAFSEDKTLTFAISAELLNNDNLEYIECYDLPDIMFYRFDKGVIKTRSKILSTSRFLNYNNIKTNSDLYNKDKIVIESLIDLSDIDDILYFFSVNTNLKKVYLKRYSLMNIQLILKLIKENKLEKVTIIVYEDQTIDNELSNDMKKIDKLSKDYGVNIKIKYSKQYKQRNIFKEFNITYLKVILLAAIIIGLIVLICYSASKKRDVENIQDNLSVIDSIIENSNIDEEPIIEETNSDEPIMVKSTYVSPYYREYSKIYGDLLQVNDDTIGWLSVNNTKVNYPVVQASDNNYYLNHSFDKGYNSIGWVYADYRNSFDNIDKNTIIYGHSMVNGGLIFTTLTNTLDASWYQNSANSIIKFSIKGTEYDWQIFSIYTIEETNDYLYVNFNNDEQYLEFLSTITERSIYDFNVPVEVNDNILTLSTCYKSGSSRIVIHAKKI